MKKQFTIIELFILIIVSILLIGTMLPVFSKSKEAALNNKCIDNLKQLGNAIGMYASDNNGFVPVYTSDPNYSPRNIQLRYYWSTFLVNNSYIPDSSPILSCPSISSTLDKNLLNHTRYLYTYGIVSIRSFNTSSPINSVDNPGGLYTEAINTKAIKKPASYVVLGDSWQVNQKNQWCLITNSGNTVGSFQTRHFNKANILLADSRVRSCYGQEIVDLMNAASELKVGLSPSIVDVNGISIVTKAP